MSNQVKAGSARGGRTVMTAILMIPVIGVLFPTCVVLGVGMLPGIVAYMIDRTGGKYLTITVALMNFCGALPGVAKLWQSGQAYDAAWRIAFDPLHWLASYGAASVGWIIYLSVPPILAAFYSRASFTRIEKLKRDQAALIETWGEEVTQAGTQNES